jgi:hypothetical protein
VKALEVGAAKGRARREARDRGRLGQRARSLADQMNDEAFKQMMLRTAADYDRLAERVALRAQKAHRQQPD